MPFHDLGLRAPITDTLRRLGFEKPTAIQEQAIPPALEGKDIIASAETGSGKTAAFLLPTMQMIMGKERRDNSRVLILVPTRELATQVYTVATELAEGTDVRCAQVYGGVAPAGQAAALRSGFEIIVATPGRLLDHAGRGMTRFAGLDLLILDEADRMLDMGFMPDIRRILGMIRSRKQTMLFSATLPREIMSFAEEILDDPVRVKVGTKAKTTVPVGITHAIFPVAERRKTALLKVLLRRDGMHSVLIFTRTKVRANQLSRALRDSGFSNGLLHGDRTQVERERELAAFADGYIRVLVATDVAARGLDVEGITHVINYDFPHSTEDYFHRVGRTARARATGDAFTLLDPNEKADVGRVEREMGASIPRVTLPEFDYEARGDDDDRRGRRGGSRGGSSRGGSSRGGSARGGSSRGGSGARRGGGGGGRRSGGGGSSRSATSKPAASKPASSSFGPPAVDTPQATGGDSAPVDAAPVKEAKKRPARRRRGGARKSSSGSAKSSDKGGSSFGPPPAEKPKSSGSDAKKSGGSGGKKGGDSGAAKKPGGESKHSGFGPPPA